MRVINIFWFAQQIPDLGLGGNIYFYIRQVGQIGSQDRGMCKKNRSYRKNSYERK